MSDPNIQLELTRDEALVLFEWLVRTDSQDALPIEDSAEQRVLWNLIGQLERLLHEPFVENYEVILKEAKRKVRESG